MLEADFEVAAGFGFFLREQRDGGVEDLGEVVRRDVGGHADGDAGAAVDDEVGDARGQNGRFARRFVVVGNEVDGVGVDVCQHFAREAGHA